MSTAYKILPHYTYEDYRRWEGQWELIDGIPYAMSPAPNIRHQRISGHLYSLFLQALARNNCHCEVLLPIDYKVSEDTVIQPDLLIVCPPAQEVKFLTAPPALVIEILSPSTAMKDRNSKFHIYQSQKIPYYILIEPDKNELEIYGLNEEGRYILVNAAAQTFTFQLCEGCTLPVDFSAIWP